MSQTSITSFFNSRKRPATEDIITSKNKVPHLSGLESSEKITRRNIQHKKCEISSLTKTSSDAKKIETDKTECAVIKLDALGKNTPDLKEKSAFSKKTSASNIVKPASSSKAEVTTSARKELSLGDIRKKLAGSSRLAELKASADRISKGIQELKGATAKKNLKEFKSLDVEVPSSPSKRSLQNESPPKQSAPSPEARPLISPRKVFVSPVKSPNKVPAYIRHAALVTNASSLPLPHHYRFLAELFRGMETVVALLFNRNEKITFSKLKPSVQEMLKRNFTEKHLAQIKHLVPDFYNFEVARIKKPDTSCQKDAYELVVSPNFPNDIKIMNPSVLLERRRYFYDTLLQLAKKHHALFLRSLDPPMIIPDTKLTRWHPNFELEKVPEVDSAKLPEMPNAEKLSTAQDVLAKARELFKCNTKMERALEKLAQAKMRGLTEEEKSVTGIADDKSGASTVTTGTQIGQPSTSGITILNPALRNLPASLLEKVKAKQAAKALEAMTRSSESDEKYFIYSRLPDLGKTLRNIFVTERKNVLALNVILSKLDSSFKSNISASDLQRDIIVLTKEVPEWIKLHEIRNTTYVRLDKNADLKSIITKLETLANKYKNN